MIEQQKGMHWAWLVFIGVCMMMAGGAGLVHNIIGNFYVPMAEELSFALPDGIPNISSITMLMTVYFIVMLIGMPFIAQLFNRVDARILFGISGILVVLAVVLLGVWTEIWQIYISGLLLGLAGPVI
jgi:MFS family permease